MVFSVLWLRSLLWLWLLALLLVHGESDHHRSSRSSSPPRHTRSNNHNHNNKNIHNKNIHHNNKNNNKNNRKTNRHGNTNNNQNDQASSSLDSSRQWLFQPLHPHQQLQHQHHPDSQSFPPDTVSSQQQQSLLLYPGQPRYVRAVDEGLHYGVIHPYAPEWNSTFGPRGEGGREVDAENAVIPCPVHFWTRCVNGVARIFFVIESLHHKPTYNQPEGGELKVTGVMQERVVLLVDGEPVRYHNWNGGADAQVDVSARLAKANTPSSGEGAGGESGVGGGSGMGGTNGMGGMGGPAWIRIGIRGFSQYTAFPLHWCVAVKPAPPSSSPSTNNRHSNNETFPTDYTNNNTSSSSTATSMNSSITSNGVRVRGGALVLVAPLVMHVHTFDQPLGQQQNPDLVRGLSRHLVYHRCALHVDHYEVVVQDEHLAQYLADPDLRSLAQQGWLTLLLKGHRPSRLHYGNCNWQSVYENLALLRYWRMPRAQTHGLGSPRVMFWNPDEYAIVVNSDNTASAGAAAAGAAAASKAINPNEPYSSSLSSLLHLSSGDGDGEGGHAVVGFRRYMVFCKGGSCLEHARTEPEARHMSLAHDVYGVGERLRDLKLVVDPDKAGCVIMHWAGCGSYLDNGDKKEQNQRQRQQQQRSRRRYVGIDDTHVLPPTTAFIAHFENLFTVRWPRNDRMVAFALNHTQKQDSPSSSPQVSHDRGLLVGQGPGPGQGLYKGPWEMTSARYPVLAKCDPYLIHPFS